MATDYEGDVAAHLLVVIEVAGMVGWLEGTN